MKKSINHLLCLLAIQTTLFGASWSEVLENHRDHLPEDSLIMRQYKAFYEGDAPPIVDPRIKGIPISENGEALIDLRASNGKRVSMMAEPSTPFAGPLYNSGLPGASKMRGPVFHRLEKLVEELDSLAPLFGHEAGQIDILLFEGLRDLGTQKMLFEKKLEEILEANPDMTLQDAERETCKWVSPVKNNTPVHSTGAAVDIRLWDNKAGTFLDLGPFGVIWGGSTFAPTFSEAITDVEKNNRLYSLLAAERAGLTNYVYEWWHFSYGDRYDLYWRESDLEEKIALYGSIAL
jgi:D-alanyl-D-alanine dipeptidase